MQKPSLPVKLACWLIIAVLGTVVLVYAKEFLLPIIIAGFLSLLLFPVYQKFLQWKIPNILSVIITMLLVAVLLFFVIFFVSKQLTAMVADIGGLGSKITDKFSFLQQYMATHLHVESNTLTNWLTNVRNKLLDYTGEFVSDTLAGTTNIMSMLALIIVYVFCFLLYNKAFKNFAFSLVGGERQSKARDMVSRIQKLVQSYLLGLLTVIVIIGILNTIGLLVIGIDHAIFFAFLTAFLTVIPYIGITIGALITTVYALLTKDTVWPAVAVISVMLGIQMLESNLITPKIVGSRVSVNPFVAIVVLLIGGQIWGISGMILSVPITAILKVLFDAHPPTRSIGYFLGSSFTDTKKEKGS